MANKEEFIEKMKTGYTFKGESLKIGSAMYEGEVIPEADIRLPLSTLNRHGLISGATGGGKTKSFQMIAELLSDAGIPSLLLDIKGDLSGIGAAATTNPKIEDRYRKLQMEFVPEAFPVELLTLSDQKGVRLRATVTEFGPILMSKILGLNDTQGGIVAMIFKFCDDHQYPLLDLQDFIKVLQYVSNEGKKELQATYGNISTSSTGTILRKVIELQQQGADMFFGERSFEVEDLLRTTRDSRGIINILRVTDIQDRPKLFSTFMLQMLAEMYSVFPEEGDMEAPKLVIFIDEAHLIFSEASKALLDQINMVIKLIRSKGVGIYFCTQNPMDVPSSVLGQLGLKIQHSLRAFTATDRTVIKQTAQNYPLTEFYKTEDLITNLGIGEALVTLLNEKGIPTPLAHVMMCTPRSRMDVLTEAEIDSIVNKSKLASTYNQVINSESAYELLNAKIAAAVEETETKEPAATKKSGKPEPTTLEKVANNSVVKSILRTTGNTLIRSFLGSLGVSTTTRKKQKTWF